MLSLHQSIDTLKLKLNYQEKTNEHITKRQSRMCQAALAHIVAHYEKPLHDIHALFDYYHRHSVLSGRQMAALPDPKFIVFIEQITESDVTPDRKVAAIKDRVSKSLNSITALKNAIKDSRTNTLSLTMTLTEYSHIYKHINALLDVLSQYLNVESVWAHRTLNDHTPFTDSMATLRSAVSAIASDSRIDANTKEHHIAHTIITAITAWYSERITQAEFEDLYHRNRGEQGTMTFKEVNSIRDALDEIVTLKALSFTDLDALMYILESRSVVIQKGIERSDTYDITPSIPYTIALKNTLNMYEEIINLAIIKDDFLKCKREVRL